MLHVPVSVKSETKLPPSVLEHFAFAEEKLSELYDIAFGDISALEKNARLFEKKRTQKNDELCQKINSLSTDNFGRKPEFKVREQIQKKALDLPLLPTTTIGSFLQTADVRANRSGFKKGAISKEEYIEFNKNKIRECILLQEKIGLDVLVHGEFERNDMVEYFGEHLDGCLFTQNGWVQSYGTRCVKPPVIWSDITRKNPITVE